VDGELEPPRVPDSVVVPGPEVVPVPAAPIPVLPLLVPEVPLVGLEPVVDVPGEVLVLVRVFVVQPAASTAAKVNPSSVTGRSVGLKAM
jgi:hypothetical protein